MFQAISISPVYSSPQIGTIKNQKLNEVLENMSHLYAQGLSNQLFEIQNFAKNIFIELDSDITKVSERFKQLTEKTKSCKEQVEFFFFFLKKKKKKIKKFIHLKILKNKMNIIYNYHHTKRIHQLLGKAIFI